MSEADTKPISPGEQALLVLVVEDEPLVQVLAIEMLEECGHRVMAAYDAGEALSLAADGEPFDVLFTDINLGCGVDGFALARRIREVFPTISVVYASGGAHGQVKSRLVSNGRFLPKPYTAADVDREIRLARMHG